MKRLVLAFSGGLDTSWCVPLFVERGWEVTTVTVDVGGFSRLYGLSAELHGRLREAT